MNEKISDEKFQSARKDFLEKFMTESYSVWMCIRSQTGDTTSWNDERDRYLYEAGKTKYVVGSIHQTGMRGWNAYNLGSGTAFRVVGRYFTQNGKWKNVRIRILVLEGRKKGKVLSLCM